MGPRVAGERYATLHQKDETHFYSRLKSIKMSLNNLINSGYISICLQFFF